MVHVFDASWEAIGLPQKILALYAQWVVIFAYPPTFVCNAKLAISSKGDYANHVQLSAHHVQDLLIIAKVANLDFINQVVMEMVFVFHVHFTAQLAQALKIV